MSKRKPLPKTTEDHVASPMDDLMGPPSLGAPKRDPDALRRERARLRSKERGKNQARYDLPSGMKTMIAEEATRLGIPASQLAAFLLAHALADLEDGRIDPLPHLTPSTSPKFRNNLEFDW